jgi:hypothetical protein
MGTRRTSTFYPDRSPLADCLAVRAEAAAMRRKGREGETREGEGWKGREGKAWDGMGSWEAPELRAGQSRAGQGRAGQGRAGQGVFAANAAGVVMSY